MGEPEWRQRKALVLGESLVPVAFKRRSALENGSHRGSHAVEGDIDDEAFTEQVESTHRTR